MLSFMNQFKKLFIFTFVIFSGADRPREQKYWLRSRTKLVLNFCLVESIGAPNNCFKGSIRKGTKVERESDLRAQKKHRTMFITRKCHIV